jgi:hypothetical protein
MLRLEKECIVVNSGVIEINQITSGSWISDCRFHSPPLRSIDHYHSYNITVNFTKVNVITSGLILLKIFYN